MGMNLSPMTFEEIQYIMGQNPMIKTMIYTLIQNPIVMNQMMNIINVLNYNPLILNQIKSMMNQELFMNNQMMNMMNNQMMNMMNNQMMNMMNNQMMNQGNLGNNFKDKEVNENPVITIYFRKRDNPPIGIQCHKKDKVSDAIRKYRIKINDFDKSKKFIYNSIPLNPSLTLEEANISDNGNVFVVVTKGIKGG